MSQTIPPLPPLISRISVPKSNFYWEKKKILTMVNSLVTENKNEILTVLPLSALFALHIGLDS